MISVSHLQCRPTHDIPLCLNVANQTSCFDVVDNKRVLTCLAPLWDIILVTMEYPIMIIICD